MNGSFVTYYRVSRASQGMEGLGMDAQERAVTAFLNGGDWTVQGTFKEVESGKRDDRPELAKAIALAKATKSKLLIAKLDRLARDLHFLTSLEKEGVEFVAVDMPGANKFTLHVMMALAQQEREMISSRTKASLASIKAKIEQDGQHVSKKGNVITKLGGRTLSDDERAKGRQARTEKANAHAAKVAPIIASMRGQNATLQAVADALNQAGLQTPRGASWTPMAVSRAEKRT